MAALGAPADASDSNTQVEDCLKIKDGLSNRLEKEYGFTFFPTLLLFLLLDLPLFSCQINSQSYLAR